MLDILVKIAYSNLKTKTKHFALPFLLVHTVLGPGKVLFFLKVVKNLVTITL